MADSEENKGNDTGFRFDLKVSEDKMTVYLTCQADAVQSDSFAADLKLHLEKIKVTAAIDDAHIGEAKAQAASAGHLVNFPIVSGVAPVMPINGRLEWTGDYFAEGYYIDPVTHRIDFHQKVENRAVEKGQLLVKVIPAVTGKDGRDVYGVAVKVAPAVGVRLRGGPHVVWDEEAGGYRAACNGRVRLVGESLDVDEVMHIRGDVGKDTGNIAHNGQLVIDGNVESEFKIEATGNIEVKGLIYASDIICGGNLVARGGINENINKRVSVKGDIVTKYIMNATVECSGNINVQAEIFQSNIRCSGEVNCNEGRIVGGEIYAVKGITVGETGSKGNVKTSLVVGVDSSLLNEIKNHTDIIDRQKDIIKKLTAVHKRLKSSWAALTPAQKEGMTEMSFKIAEAEEDILEREEKSKELRKQAYANRDARIVIMQMVYPGAALRVADTQTGISETLLGPVVVYQDRVSRQLAMSSELANKAEEVS
jgi:uncharacterized protein (DUF342 family)